MSASVQTDCSYVAENIDRRDDDDDGDDGGGGVQRSKVPLCADSKLYYERYRPYSLIDGELVSTTEADDSCVVDQQTSDADQLPDDSESCWITLSLILSHVSRIV